jgi:hypothetical protein
MNSCPASYPRRLAEEPAWCPGFLLPFGHRRSLLGSSISRWGVGPSLRSAYRSLLKGAGPHRGSHVPHVRDSTGVGASCIPGTVVLTRSTRNTRPAPAALLRPVPTPRSNIPSCEVLYNETSTEVHAIHPSGLPLARNPRMERGSFGFPSSCAPRRYQRRTSRVGPGH